MLIYLHEVVAIFKELPGIKILILIPIFVLWTWLYNLDDCLSYLWDQLVARIIAGRLKDVGIYLWK